MILSNVDMVAAIQDGGIIIDPQPNLDPTQAPFNTTSLDLRLGQNIVIPKSDQMGPYSLSSPYSFEYMARNSDRVTISDQQPFVLKQHQLVLGQTVERIELPIREGKTAYSARVEGKSSRARLGLVVHLTAPTIHCAFSGPITLELINFGKCDINLTPNVYICTLIFEIVSSTPSQAPNQFSGQVTPEGSRS